ncbi:transporter substrate-binding domain-containing protein [Undibacterium cyanobacteriorum]|uniref:Transporter substrate-binding domain-containing protein n=1 Tax=Undibacterium cyanobacteriorum TaxID=3073561 RepID=A0ABY9RJG1_9BURK|nr:transporter substrate-binding domain-containing protein [Undibacterium sp. 20NA77.5]WMW81363.1 transporter substrate-binding domain-containing protein [Undibacterium sp. 20NA77.5]
MEVRSGDKDAVVKIALFGQEILDRDGRPTKETQGVKRFLDYFRREAKIDFSFQRLPWRRAQAMTLEGKGIIWEFSKNKERLLSYRFSEPVMSSKIWAIAYGEPHLKLDHINDLRGKTVAVERGVSHGMEFDDAAGKLFRVDEDTASAAARFRKLMAKRSDVLLWGLVQFDKPQDLINYLHQMYIPSLQDSSLNGVKFYTSSKPLFLDTIHFASKKGSYEEVMQRLDVAIRRGLASGELLQILREM